MHTCNKINVYMLSYSNYIIHNDVIMSTMASQTTSLTIVYWTVYSRRRSKKTSKLRVSGLCEGNSPVTGEFPSHRASNAENVCIWWRHHDVQPVTPADLGAWPADNIEAEAVRWLGDSEKRSESISKYWPQSTVCPNFTPSFRVTDLCVGTSPVTRTKGQ